LASLEVDPAKRAAASLLADVARALFELPTCSVGSGERRTVVTLCRTGDRLDMAWKAHASAQSETTFARACETLLPPLLKALEPFMVGVPSGSVVHFTCPPCHAGASAPLLPLLKALALVAVAQWGVQCVVSPIERTVAQPRAKERPRACSEAELDEQARVAADSMDASMLAPAGFVVIVDNVIATGTTLCATRISVVHARGVGAVTKFSSIAIAEGLECAALPYVASALPSEMVADVDAELARRPVAAATCERIKPGFAKLSATVRGLDPRGVLWQKLVLKLPDAVLVALEHDARLFPPQDHLPPVTDTTEAGVYVHVKKVSRAELEELAARPNLRPELRAAVAANLKLLDENPHLGFVYMNYVGVSKDVPQRHTGTEDCGKYVILSDLAGVGAPRESRMLFEQPAVDAVVAAARGATNVGNVLYLGEAVGGLLLGGKMAYIDGGANIAPLGIACSSPLAELSVGVRNITLAVMRAEPAAARTVGDFNGTRAVVRSLAAPGWLERDFTSVYVELTRLVGPAGVDAVTLGAVFAVRVCVLCRRACDRLHRRCPQKNA
jgi:hypothetical protein